MSVFGLIPIEWQLVCVGRRECVFRLLRCFVRVASLINHRHSIKFSGAHIGIQPKDMDGKERVKLR